MLATKGAFVEWAEKQNPARRTEFFARRGIALDRAFARWRILTSVADAESFLS
jgi:hypothetical protein